jgi:succinyl-CoA synthetase beta subunit
MNLHEYQAKNLLKKYGIDIPNHIIATTSKEAEMATSILAGKKYAIKAQIHSGGRGKAGGVRIISSSSEAKEFTELWLGKKLTTYQNKPFGQPVHRILVEESVEIHHELYFSMLVDRQAEKIVLICSSSGGIEIEAISKNSPDLIYKAWVSIHQQFSDGDLNYLCASLKLTKEVSTAFKALAIESLKLFTENDLTLLEINPLVITKNMHLIALDCKISIDSNALFKHPHIIDLQDWTQIDFKEAEAHHSGLNYIALEGNIGCMVNGAGLAMATMDLIKLSGGEPANFLDVGGSATAETVSKAFKILLSDPNVQVVLVNIFGGIMRCDIIANGIVAAIKEGNIQIPIVVRLEGTNVDLGKKILRQSKLNITPADSLTDAAIQSVNLACKVK